MLFDYYFDELVAHGEEIDEEVKEEEGKEEEGKEEEGKEENEGDLKDLGLTPEQQKKYNAILKREKEKFRKNTKTTLSQLEQLQKSKSLNDEERKELAGQVDQLKKSLMTKEQLAQEERLKLQNQHKEELSGVSKERDNWRDLYSNSTIERAIIDAAVEHQAFDPEQIIAILKPKTELEQDTEINKLTPKVKIQEENAEGKMVTLSLTPSEAVKRMTDKDKYFNLFKTTAKGGLGGNNSSSSVGNLDPKKIAEIAKDPELFKKYRDQILNSLG